MGLQPIDLQVMYTQSANVSKTAAGAQQAAQLSESMQHTKIIQDNLENINRVQQASDDKAQSQTVNEDGRGNSGGSGSEKRNPSENKNPEQNNTQFSNLKESYLGTIIDITR